MREDAEQEERERDSLSSIQQLCTAIKKIWNHHSINYLHLWGSQSFCCLLNLETCLFFYFSFCAHSSIVMTMFWGRGPDIFVLRPGVYKPVVKVAIVTNINTTTSCSQTAEMCGWSHSRFIHHQRGENTEGSSWPAPSAHNKVLQTCDIL